jgi:GNAT superfamily N-acetyltransferase
MARGDIAFRPIREGDLDGVQAMQARSFAGLGRGANTAEEIQAHVAEIMAPAYRSELLANHLIVAEDDGGRIVGTAGWCAMADRPRTARIRKVFVDPDHAGTGLGRRLVEAAEADALVQGFRDFAVRSNINAVPFYERLGYRAERAGTMATHSGVDLRVVFMAKPASAIPSP